jgi:hypothetical protein
MILSLKLVDNNQKITLDILKAILPQVNKYMVFNTNNLKAKIPEIIRKAIIGTPEYESLISGKLKYEFGISDSVEKLSGLLELWSSRIMIKYKKPVISRDKILSSISINMIRVDFSDVLYSEYAYVVDSLRGYSLPWLEWLLLEGNRTIVKDYNVKIGLNKYSRTGLAIMVPSKQSWRVPSEFAGTISNNWITRAIQAAEDDIQSLLDRTFNQ